MNVKYKLALSVFAVLASNISLADVKEISLQEIQGNLVVDSEGSRFPGNNGTVLKVGDLVMVPANAAGKIVDGNCTYVLEPKTVVKVVSGSCEFAAAPYGATVAAPGVANSTTEKVAGYKLSNVIGLVAIVGGAAALASSGGSGGGSSNASAE